MAHLRGRLPQSVWAAVTEVPWTRLNQQTFVAHSSGDWKSKVRISTWPSSGEGPLPSYRLHILIVFSHSREEKQVPCGSSKGINSIHEGSTLWPYLILITSQGPHLLIPLRWGVVFKIWILGEHKNFVHSITTLKWLPILSPTMFFHSSYTLYVLCSLCLKYLFFLSLLVIIIQGPI